jgi:hypothetical protein
MEIVLLTVEGLPGDFKLGRHVQELCCEYLMIEAAAHGQDKICGMLLSYCDLTACTL